MSDDLPVPDRPAAGGPASDDPAFDDLVIAYLETGAIDTAQHERLADASRAALADDLADLDAVRQELATPATWEASPAGLEASILDAILAEPPAATSSSAAPVAPLASAPADPGGSDGSGGSAGSGGSGATSLAEARARRARGVAVVASLVAAAAVVLAIVGFATRPAGPRGESAAGPPTSAPPTSGAVSPPVTIGPGTEAALEPTDLLPGATGTVRLDTTVSGVWIRLDASGLPRRDNGEFYQAWVKTAHGLVPIGTFHTGDRVVLWSGVAIEDTSAVTVTLEKDDGNQDSSGQRVLVATIGGAGSTGPAATAPPATTRPG